jgi:hypothetical protein
MLEHRSAKPQSGGLFPRSYLQYAWVIHHGSARGLINAGTANREGHGHIASGKLPAGLPPKRSLLLLASSPTLLMVAHCVALSQDVPELHIGMRTGFCGSLTTFASWEYSLVTALIGGMSSLLSV